MRPASRKSSSHARSPRGCGRGAPQSPPAVTGRLQSLCAVDTCLGSLPRGSLRQPSENRPEAEESGRRSSRRARWEGGSRSPRWPSHRAAVSSRPPLSSCLEARRQAQPPAEAGGCTGGCAGSGQRGPPRPSPFFPAPGEGRGGRACRLPPATAVSFHEDANPPVQK